MELDLAQLNSEVGRLEAETAQLEIEKATLAKAASRIRASPHVIFDFPAG